jgi:hypothetical protein
VAELVALPPDIPPAKPPRSRAYWWTCFYEDLDGARVPVFYGRLIIVLGAASG